MNAAFTPGPWSTKPKRFSPDGLGNQGVNDANGNCIATVLIHASAQAEGPRRLADARLIAAAPDLLEALQKALSALAPLSGDHFNPVYSVNELREARAIVEAAIAKAVQP